MVIRGQFLERPTLIRVGEAVLEGLSHRGERPPPLLMIPPRPEEGGSMDHVVAAELAWAAATRGHATLRFNFRGVGASQGAVGDERTRFEDAQAALRLLGENVSRAEGAGVPTAVAAIGGSAKTAIDLARRHGSVCGLALISPRLAPEELLRARSPLLVVVGEEDALLPRAALAAAVAEAGGALEVIDGADRAFTRNLPQVGRTVAQWLERLG